MSYITVRGYTGQTFNRKAKNMTKQTVPIFSLDEIDATPTTGTETIRKRDNASGREMTLLCTNYGGVGRWTLRVWGPGVPGIVRVQCDRDQVNLIARLLIDAQFDETLISE